MHAPYKLVVTATVIQIAQPLSRSQACVYEQLNDGIRGADDQVVIVASYELTEKT